jgi:lipopolysaccharide/colanic/teichoic acid biosynthesis glycosyltransferase
MQNFLFMKSVSFNQNTNLIVIRQNKTFSLNNKTSELLRFTFCNEPLAGIILSDLNGDSYPRSNHYSLAVPQDWVCTTTNGRSSIIYYKDKIRLSLGFTNSLKTKPWYIVSNGRFITRINLHWLYNLLAELHADVVAVNISHQLQAGQEKTLTNSHGKLVGFRRFYDDSAQAAPIPDDWPHHLFIKTGILKKLLYKDTLPSSFTEFVNSCFSHSLTVSSINIGGTIMDLGTEEGLLGVIAARLGSRDTNGYQEKILHKDGIKIATGARLIGKVCLGQDINIGPNAIIVGPTVISNGVKIAKGVVIKTSVVGSGVSVPPNSIIQNRVLINGQKLQKYIRRAKADCKTVITDGATYYKNSCTNNFRTWPKYSYPRCVKRIADIIIAMVLIILLAPVFPIIAVVIKLTSLGPVFFRDIRQGLHGKIFNCLKFRTMLVGADYLQDKLRSLNQADGPQFKMSDDPRLSPIGKFLRDTYIDEIPQFFNVLLGKMSIVGPRPSPESENTLCPPWRDARLSVRPGITGLWQVCRTRQPMKDFQEWIYYDTKYVRDLSLRMDLLICWKTIKKLLKEFVSQF